MGIVLVFTSMVDLFIDRLFFRAGPDVLAHVQVMDNAGVAALGRVALTLEQLALFVLLASAAALLLSKQGALHKILGGLLVLVLVCAAGLYASPPGEFSWFASTLLVLATGVTISGLAAHRAWNDRGRPRTQRLALQGFLALLALSFWFPLYVRLDLLYGAKSATPLPLAAEAYQAAIYLVMATILAAFVHALAAPSPGFPMNRRNFAKAALLPSLLVAPLLFGLLSSFFMTQILVMVVAMSTGFALSHSMLQLLVFLWWFYLVAIMLLFLKGRGSADKSHLQEAAGLILLMSTTFLFGYPQYLLLGISGVLLLCHPVLEAAAGPSPRRSPVHRPLGLGRAATVPIVGEAAGLAEEKGEAVG